MSHTVIITELTGYIKRMETFDKDAAQDGFKMREYLLELTTICARSNFLKAEYGKNFRTAKKNAYLKLSASSYANDRYFAPSLAKDYVDSCCSESGFIFDLADRCSASCVHTIDAIRTIISDLKSERNFANL